MSDICPICGGKLGKEILLTNPPSRGRKCMKCGRVDEILSIIITRSPKNRFRWKEPWSTY